MDKSANNVLMSLAEDSGYEIATIKTRGVPERELRYARDKFKNAACKNNSKFLEVRRNGEYIFLAKSR